MMAACSISIVGLLVLCLMSVLLAVYAGMSKGRAGVPSGPVVPADDARPVFRIDRAHMNSVQALTPFVVPAMLAMMVGVGAATLATLVWLHLALRLVHLTVYLRGGRAALGGNLRTILFVASTFVTLVLVLVTGWVATHS